MTAPNHIVGGFTFTGVFASIAGINILQDYRLLPIILLASLLPDIDSHQSIIGRLFYPIAKAINRKYGHRTITHSLIVLIALTALISGFQAAYFPNIKVAQVFGLAYGSHLLFDMMTINGVPLFYPFKKNPCVLPGNPEMRLRTNNLRQETAVFCGFIVSAVFLQPLMANGFWTSYNVLFGTIKHLQSEYHKSDDLLKVSFLAQRGSELDSIQGYLVAMEGSSLTLIDKKKRFHTYPREDELLRDFIPHHTGISYSFYEGDIDGITADSLMHFVKDCECTAIDVQATDKFLLSQNGIESKKSKLALSYPNHLHISEIKADEVQYQTNPDIAVTESEINLLQRSYDDELRFYQEDLHTYQDLEHRMRTASNYVTKEILMEEFKTAKKPIPPRSIEDKIARLHARIDALRTADAQEYQSAKEKLERPELTFSGTFTQLLINGKNK